MSIHFFACFLYFFVHDVNFLIIVRFIHGLGFGASANAIVTIASAILPEKRFGEAFGYFMLGTTIAIGLGPYIGGYLYDNFSSFGCFTAATAFSAVALLCVSLIDIDKYDSKRNSENNENDNYSFLEKIFEIKAIPVSFFTALTALGYVSILSFYRLYAVEVNLVDAFSWFFIIYSICLVLSRPVAGRIQDNGGDLIVCRNFFNSIFSFIYYCFHLCSLFGFRFWYFKFCMYYYRYKKFSRKSSFLCTFDIFHFL